MHARTTTRFLALALALAAGTTLAAEPEVAAQQFNVRSPVNTVIGGGVQQRFAQTFELYYRGEVSHLTLPVGCAPNANLIVTLETVNRSGVPSGVILTEQRVPGSILHAYPTPAVPFNLIEFTRPVTLDPGTYAFTLTRKGRGDCTLYVGPDGDTYPQGKAWFIANGNPPYWIESFFIPGVTHDLAFQLYARPR